MPNNILDPVEIDKPTEPVGILMAFDFGTKRIGVAVGQALTKSASPQKTLQAKEGIPDWKVLDKLIKDWRPSALLVGIPLNMDGSEQTITKKAKAFALQLKDKYHLPVYGVDERLTSFSARQELFETGGYRAIQKSDVDSLAAKLILESWLQNNVREN